MSDKTKTPYVAMKSLLSIILFGTVISLYSSVGAQNWEKTYGNPGLSQFHDIEILPDSSVILAGFDQHMLWISRIDDHGKVLWQQHKNYSHITSNTSDKLIQLTKLKNGEFVIVGNYAKNQEGVKDQFVYWFNENGDSIRMRIWEDNLDNQSPPVSQLIATSDYGCAVLEDIPLTHVSGVTQKSVIAVTKFNKYRNFSWTQKYDIMPADSNGIVWSEHGTDLVETNNNFYISGYIDKDSISNQVPNKLESRAFLAKTDQNGNIVWTVIRKSGPFIKSMFISGKNELIGIDNDSIFIIDVNSGNVISGFNYKNACGGCIGTSIVELPDKSAAIVGNSSSAGSSQGVLIKTDILYHTIWSHEYGGSGDEHFFSTVNFFNNGFYIAGSTTSFGENGYLLKTDPYGSTVKKFIGGRVFVDIDKNCKLGTNDQQLSGIFVKAFTGKDTLYSISTDAGDFSFLLDTSSSGNLHIEANTGPYWKNQCTSLSGIDTSMKSGMDSMIMNFSLTPAALSPYLTLDIATNRLRRCFPNNYVVQYCNKGTKEALNAYVNIELDELLSLNSSSIPWDQKIGGNYRFPVGNVAVGQCGNFTINTSVSCDASLNQIHCVEAKIFPDSLITPANSTWDSSNLIIEGDCIDDDTVEFRIRNTGTGDMDGPRQLIVIEDIIMIVNTPIQLLAGEVHKVSFPANGSTYTAMIDQSPGHPFSTFASDFVEGCGTNAQGTFSTGIAKMFPKPDESPFVSIDCHENVGSWDPNDKQVNPVGIGAGHIISRNTDLEYLIRFQNTGTDTAFTVKIIDTIDRNLDISSIQLGASSHSFRLQIHGNNTLQFTFENINLPDSNTNEDASHGFVKYKIAQKPDLTDGTLIENTAAIYFDFNEAVVTNTVQNKVGEISVFVEELNEQDLRINAYPNPLTIYTVIKVEGKRDFRELELLVYNLKGEIIKRLKGYNTKQFEISAEDIPAGIYFFKVKEKNNEIGGGKIIVQ